jgi:hypothetical protein
MAGSLFSSALEHAERERTNAKTVRIMRERESILLVILFLMLVI